jgi:hypothetical protein
MRLLKRVEVRVMNRWVRRSYLEQWNSSVQLDPMLPFAFTKLDDIVSPHATQDQDISFCPICDCEVSTYLHLLSLVCSSICFRVSSKSRNAAYLDVFG